MDGSSNGKIEMAGTGSPFHSGGGGALSFPSDRPAGAAASSSSSSSSVLDIFGQAVAGVNDFIGSLGSKGSTVGGNVARPYGEISVNRSTGAAGSGTAAGASSPLGKGGIFGSRPTSFLQAASAYKRVEEEEEDEDGITEINL
jgi:hypothetical protein